MPHPVVRRLAIGLLLAGITSLTAQAAQAAQAAQCPLAEVPEAEAWALHSRVISVDTHIDIDPRYATDQHDPGGFTRGQNDLPKMRAGGLDAAFLILYSGQGVLDEAGISAARELVETKYRGIQRLVRAYPDQVGLATSADEVLTLHAQGKRAVLMGMENAYPLGMDVSQVPIWAARGVRYVGITHMGHNQFGGSSNPKTELGDADKDPGLTPLGRQLVAALNDAGIMIDVSHVGPRTMMEATRLSRAPVIASHSGVMGVHRNLRNLEDEQLDAIRASGGVAQMVAFRDYVGEIDPAIREGQDALRRQHFPNGWASAKPDAMSAYIAAMADLRKAHRDVTLADFVDHIDYAVRRIGIGHVGIASDFDGGGGVAGWDDTSEAANVTRELMRRCYSEEQIRALWGGNLLRVMRDVEAKAR